MKIKYYRLSKEERKQYRDKFYATKKGKTFKKYTGYSYLMCILLVAFSIYYVIDAYINKLSKWYYIYASILLIISIIMALSVRKVRVTKINDYIVKK